MKQKGFTLLEALITLTLVSILLAIAIPSYLEYLARGQVTEGVSMAHGMVDEIQEYYGYNQALPPGLADIAPGRVPGDYSGRYVTQVDISNGQIIATFGYEAGSAITGQTLALNAYANGAGTLFYFCDGITPPLGLTRTDLGAGSTTVADEYLPADCR